jgi:lipoyl(octanoyl) transferase
MTVAIRELGRIDFASAHARMRELAAVVARGDSAGEVWLLEHDAVFTAGRATPAQERLAIDAVPVERGGQITFHGPGQLVVYPIMRLPWRDAGAWLRCLEAFGAAVCAHFGVQATASADGTGVFVAGKKIGSIGVALRRWVNLHGIALNVCMDLAPFFAVRPCGLAPDVMSDLSRAAGRPISMVEATRAARIAVPLLFAAPTSKTEA